MKKLHVIITMLIVITLFTGCGSAPATAGGRQESAPATTTAPAAATQSNVPSWLDELPTADAFWGIGYIRLQDESAALRTATRLARQDIAEQLSTLVQGMMTNYYREAGGLNDPTAIRHIEEVGRFVWNADVSMAIVNNRTLVNGAWWVRVGLRKSDARNTIVDILDNEASRYATWRRDEAIRMLDHELARSQSRPTPRTE